MSLIALMWAGAGIGQASAQSGEAPGLYDQMENVLGINQQFGCTANSDFLPEDLEGPSWEFVDFGAQLQALCFSLNDTSSNGGGSSSLGGSLNSVQSTKTVSEFRAARRRIDQRLRNSRRPPPRRLAYYADDAAASDAPPLAIDAYEDGDARFGVFGSLHWEQRDRAATRLASAQDGEVASGVLGFDYFWGSGAAGLFLTYSETDDTILASEPVALRIYMNAFDTGGTVDQEFTNFLRDGDNLERACGGAVGGGEISSEGAGLGGFLGWAIGETGFLDVAFSHSRTEVRYTRSLCVVTHSLPQTVSNMPRIFFSDDGVDADETGAAQRLWVSRETGFSLESDRYAGFIFGQPEVQETNVSMRGGTNIVENESISFGPRATLTYSRGRTAGYAETGSATIATTIYDKCTLTDVSECPPVAAVFRERELGGPIGLELAYDEQERESLVLELGAEGSFNIETGFGAWVPYASAYWRREFKDDLRFATVHFVQDERPEPYRFSFGVEDPDPDAGIVTLGLAAVGEHLSAQLEYSTLVADDLVGSRAITASARLRF